MTLILLSQGFLYFRVTSSCIFWCELSCFLFIARCVIAELFAEGTPPFDLSQLLAYMMGEYSPHELYHKIDDFNIRVCGRWFNTLKHVLRDTVVWDTLRPGVASQNGFLLAPCQKSLCSPHVKKHLFSNTGHIWALRYWDVPWRQVHCIWIP